MIDTVRARSRAIVIHPALAGPERRDPELRLAEAQGLAEALDLEVAAAEIASLRELKPKAYFGAGKVAEVAARVEELKADVVVVDAAVTPVQQRNLEKAWNAKVLDRTGLILEIFGLRARTREGRLQVELARLAYEKSRLVRTWTHLERQRGGRGFLAGPGETQIETDRRLIVDKMAKLRAELEEVRRTRGLHRSQRKKVPYPLVALVGYTNAGKSTLFNTLTKAGVLAKDMPFATLDPTLRALKLPSGLPAMLSDTVGFISDLPTELVAAFQATLEEVAEADLLVHVRDIAHPESDAQKDDVETILERLGAGETGGQRVLEVWNKADLLEAERQEALRLVARRQRQEEGRAACLLSAVTGEGVAGFVAAIEAILSEGMEVHRLRLGPEDGRPLAWLHAHGEVLAERAAPDGRMHALVRLSAVAAGRFRRAFPDIGLHAPDRSAAE